MSTDSRVVLDACVLIPMPLADTLLRMAEAPRLFLPKWSPTIMNEVPRKLVGKWGMPPEKARRREDELRRHFPEAWVEGYEPLINAMTNHPGDRHVLAAAIRSNSELIVTYNQRHFPGDSVQRWDIEVQGPSTFLRRLYDLDAGLFMNKLCEQAEVIGLTLPNLLHNLSTNVPAFIHYLCQQRGIGFVSVCSPEDD
ncbi:MAG: PIN domain-containing protein [Bryobacteraceae bacterium]